MKAGFFHDHSFVRDGEGVYYSHGNLPYATLERYLEHFQDGLLVVGRERMARDAVRAFEGRSSWDALARSSGPGVQMACFAHHPWYDCIGRGAVMRAVRSALERVDGAIIRLPSVVGLVAVEEVARLKKPWMVELVGCAWDALWNHGAAAAKAVALPMFLLCRRAVSLAPRVLYVTARFLQERYPSNGATGACSDVRLPPQRLETLERRLSRIQDTRPDAPLTLGLVGSMDVEYKGHETAILALSALRERAPRLTLRFLGSGKAERWLSLARSVGVGDRVELSGTLPSGAAVMDWLDDLDVFLAPSRQEGLPRALIEAMSRALPAIGSRVGGVPELLAGPDLHDPGDHGALARRLADLAGSPEARMISACRSFEKASEYQAVILDAKRSAFLGEFAEEVRHGARE